MTTTTGIARETLVAELTKANDEARRMQQAFPVDTKGRFEIPRQMHDDFLAQVRKSDEIKALITAEDALSNAEQFASAPATVPTSGADAGRAPAGGGAEFKSLGDMFVESDEFKRMQAAGGIDRVGRVRAEMEGKSIFNMSAGAVTLPAFGSKQDLGLTEMQRRQWHVRDLFPKATTTAAILYGIRETGWVNNAAQVRQRYAADGVSVPTGGPTDVWGRAPKSNITFKPVTFPIAEIAHTLDAHKNVLADEPRLKELLNNRMIEMLRFREDHDLLHSVGDGEKITGLFNTPGVQQYAGKKTEGRSVQVRRAITRAALAEYAPTGLVCGPEAWEELEVETDDTGAFRVALAVAVGAEKRIWRLNVVETTAMASEQFLLGAFGMGAQIYDREQASVTISTENRTNFEDGVVSVRADARVGMVCERPEAFVVGTWDADDDTP